MMARVARYSARVAGDIWQGHLYAWRAIGEFVVAHPIPCVAALILVQVVIVTY